ncbi:hypothetical protein N9X37_05040 [Planktomarina temperata]|nr:hypothetical protein [Planktomarina temperata]
MWLRQREFTRVKHRCISANQDLNLALLSNNCVTTHTHAVDDTLTNTEKPRLSLEGYTPASILKRELNTLLFKSCDYLGKRIVLHDLRQVCITVVKLKSLDGRYPYVGSFA